MATTASQPVQDDAHPRDDGARPRLEPDSAGRTGMRRPALTLTDAEDAKRFRIEREWTKMCPVMLGAGVGFALLTLSLPPLVSLGAIGVAALLSLSAAKAESYERGADSHELQRFAAMVVSIALPMLLFGIGIAAWANAAPDPAWKIAIGMLVVVGVVGSTISSGRVRAVFAVNIAGWTGPVLYSGIPAAYVLFAASIALGAIALRFKARRDVRDAGRMQEMERAQIRAREMLSEYEQSGMGWFWETDRRGALVYVSPTIGKVLGCNTDDLLGQPFSELFILGDSAQESERTLTFHLSARSPFTDLAMRAASGGEERWWSISGRPILDTFNNFIGFRGFGSDLTEQKRSKENETRLAHFDSLTSLANRFQMSQTLEKILSALREDHRACAVFLLDLDRFKQVNDTMGHPVGDALLTQVAKRLEGTVGKAGRVGRLGGDEFQVILAGRHRREDLAGLAGRIIEKLSQPYSIEGNSVVIGVSIGIAISPDDGVTSEALIRNADLALYAAKDGGRGRYHFYASDLHSDAEERRQLEHDLREALVSGGLEMYYQPVVHTTTEKITGFEALMRWNHPEQGLLSPTKFIPIAEDAGLIAQIGEWALRTACADLAKWPDGVRVAVNVSPLQFANPALPAIVTNALASAQVDPARLELEITESVFLNDDENTDAMFAALKRVGVRLALDDFGTGYSSLGYLKKAPFDKIKIDQSFVRGATMKGSRNGAIISSIVSLAESLGMETTAEGVETLDELDLVRALGCSHIQGFIYERPLKALDASDQLAAGL
ncbi:MAG: putative bifunctional diguanylate cyclase/phosphodiesterase, partial [Rhizobiaceae bacterium]